MNDLRKIPTMQDVEKLNYCVTRLIQEREEKGQLEGSLKKKMLFNPNWLAELFKKADAEYDAEGRPCEDFIGLHYYLYFLRCLPIDQAKGWQIKIAQELKRRKELIRQRLDAGNMDKEVKKVCSDKYNIQSN